MDAWRPVEEFLEELEQDASYVAARDAYRREHSREVAANLAEMAPLREELRAAGYDVDGPLSAFYNTHQRTKAYREAVPILVRWLPRVERPNVKAELAIALHTRIARPAAAAALLHELRTYHDSHTRWHIAQALGATADRSFYDDLAELALDPELGVNRGGLAEGIGRLGGPDAGKILIEMAKDPAITVLALDGLRLLRDPATRDAIEPYTQPNENEQIPTRARRALKAIDERPRSFPS